MVANETQSILRRKAALGTKEQEARAMSVAKAMRQTIAKLGKELFEMPLSAIGAVTEDRKIADLPEIVGDGALLCLLEGDDGRVGAAIIGADIVGGLIQQQTMGRVAAANGANRAMTQTDAAMCAPLLNLLFERVTPLLEVKVEQDVVAGFHFGAQFEDARSLELALDMPEYFVVRLTLDLAGGIRQGVLSLILPKVLPAQSSGPDPSSKTTENAAICPQMEDVVMGLPTELNIVLCKVSLELAQLKQLSVGEVVRLPHGTFPDAEIMTQTGVNIGSGVLGQVNGMRALRFKRVPVHATQPRRRESDLAELDLPEMTALRTQEKGKSNDKITPNVAGVSVDAGVNNQVDKWNASDTELAELDKTLIDKTDLPELDDLPDLAELSKAG